MDAADGESPKAENLLKTKGKVLRFSLPKAENVLKTSQLRETQDKELGMANGSQRGPDNSIYWRGEISDRKKQTRELTENKHPVYDPDEKRTWQLPHRKAAYNIP